MTTKKQAIIVDLDGTLCNCDHRRHFVDSASGKKDWPSFYEAMTDDAVNVWCRKIVNTYPAATILVSGRPEEYRKHTEDWLIKNSICADGLHLLMRKTGDYRDDTIIKEEIYKEHIEPYYKILFAVDDRPKVCRMWRSLGLICLQCNDKEF